MRQELKIPNKAHQSLRYPPLEGAGGGTNGTSWTKE